MSVSMLSLLAFECLYVEQFTLDRVLQSRRPRESFFLHFFCILNCYILWLFLQLCMGVLRHFVYTWFGKCFNSPNAIYGWLLVFLPFFCFIRFSVERVMQFSKSTQQKNTKIQPFLDCMWHAMWFFHRLQLFELFLFFLSFVLFFPLPIPFTSFQLDFACMHSIRVFCTLVYVSFICLTRLNLCFSMDLSVRVRLLDLHTKPIIHFFLVRFASSCVGQLKIFWTNLQERKKNNTKIAHLR